MTDPARDRRIKDEPDISDSISFAASPESAGISVRQAEKLCSRYGTLMVFLPHQMGRGIILLFAAHFV